MVANDSCHLIWFAPCRPPRLKTSVVCRSPYVEFITKQSINFFGARRISSSTFQAAVSHNEQCQVASANSSWLRCYFLERLCVCVGPANNGKNKFCMICAAFSCSAMLVGSTGLSFFVCIVNLCKNRWWNAVLVPTIMNLWSFDTMFVVHARRWRLCPCCSPYPRLAHTCGTSRWIYSYSFYIHAPRTGISKLRVLLFDRHSEAIESVDFILSCYWHRYSIDSRSVIESHELLIHVNCMN